MKNTHIVLKKVSKDFYIYRKNIQRVMGILFDREPDETKHALTDVSLSIEQGERVAVIGRTEAGCSTLLKIISGTIFPTKGKVDVKGSINALLNRKVGYDNEFTARENIYLKANLVGIPKDVIREHEDEIIEFAGIRDFIDLPFKRAPKGTKLKVAMAVHLLQPADILLFEERISGIGTRDLQDCRDLLRKYLDDNPDVTLLITKSSMTFAKSICNRGIILDEGRIVFDGDLEEAYEKYKTEYKPKKEDNSESEELQD